MPDEPENDPITQHVIDVFRVVNRSRRYLVGATRSVPLPISVEDINTVLAAHRSPLSREELDAGIFALDKEWLTSLE